MDFDSINSGEDLKVIFGKFVIAKEELSKILEKKIVSRSWEKI